MTIKKMQYLLSLPSNLVGCFHEVTGLDPQQWFCASDPVGRKLGSGGGTAHLLNRYEQHVSCAQSPARGSRKIILHAGGQSRRLPAYAPSGKILTPIPVFRWERGQLLSQTLLDIQIPLYNQIMEAAPDSLTTMIVSGDVFIRATEPLQPIPRADVVCYGLWLGPEIAKDHGIFVADRRQPNRLKRMMQKPSVEVLGNLLKDHLYLTDIGIWLLSEKAVELLRKKATRDGEVVCYDLYSDFGRALGDDPEVQDPELAALTVAVLPLPGGEFYHYGTTREIISSTLEVQNLVNDQRRIIHRSRKPHPSMFIQNSETWVRPSADNQYLWIENSCISEQWTLAHHHVITGVPENVWKIELRPGQCIDIVPVGDSQYVVRPYGFSDAFRGAVTDPQTLFLGQPFGQWAAGRRIDPTTIEGGDDLQSARIFPVVDNAHDMGLVLRWMLNEPYQDGGRMLWDMSRRMSADEISAEANLARLEAQRRGNRAKNWPFLARNYEHSVFYQLDLADAAREFADNNIALPSPLTDDTPLLTRIHDAMFRSELLRLRQKDGQAAVEEGRAFGLLRQGLTAAAMAQRQSPHLSVYADQIVWGRSPVRIDIGGGWTDTPPFCLMEGGAVINLAVELNGQQPIQAYVKPSQAYHITLRSIDLGASEEVTTYGQLADFHHVGSPFSIPKAALVLAGFHPDFSTGRYDSLEEQLRAFGSGIEVTLLSAIPAGSGLGTSSVLAATVLGALNDFCGLAWDRNEIGHRTLVLEQLLTTGGGWQDQFGGLLQGVKLLQTTDGFDQVPTMRWLPNELFTQPDYRACHLLFYTGITRTAKKILAEIVRKMFLNQHDELAQLRAMKAHTMEMYEALQRNDFETMGRLVRRTWAQNQALDSGTNPPEVQRLTTLIDDLCLGYKLPGAGGGGYLYMIAKDPEAAARIRQLLLTDPQRNANARFVSMSLSPTGLQVSRS